VKHYRIQPRTGTQTNGHKTYFLGVPWQIAEAVPGDILFEVELTDEGILFRPVTKVDAPLPEKLPAWVTA
jgi:hypothetical protein